GVAPQAGDDLSDGNWPARIEEHLQHASRGRRLSRGTPPLAFPLHVEGNQLIGRQDQEARHSCPPLPVWLHDKLCSNSRLKTFLGGGQAWPAQLGWRWVGSHSAPGRT